LQSENVWLSSPSFQEGVSARGGQESLPRFKSMTKISNRYKNKPIRRILRRQLTKGEVILWKRLQYDQLGYRFRRQFGIGKYVADFYCPKLKLAIEVDGYSHLDEKVFENDQVRQTYLEDLGIKVIRYNSEEIFNNLPQVLEQIYFICQKLEK